MAASALLTAQTVSGTDGQAKLKAQKALTQLPLSFEPNLGQTERAVQFVAHAPAADIYLNGPDAVISRVAMKTDEHKRVTVAGRSTVRMHLLDAGEGLVETPESALPGKVNYLVGNGPGALAHECSDLERCAHGCSVSGCRSSLLRSCRITGV